MSGLDRERPNLYGLQVVNQENAEHLRKIYNQPILTVLIFGKKPADTAQ